jgi:hypothetical protein
VSVDSPEDADQAINELKKQKLAPGLPAPQGRRRRAARRDFSGLISPSKFPGCRPPQGPVLDRLGAWRRTARPGCGRMRGLHRLPIATQSGELLLPSGFIKGAAEGARRSFSSGKKT